MLRKAAGRDRAQFGVRSTGTTAVLDAPNPNYVAERLRAHARLCRHIAEEIWSEQKAVELLRMAEECTRAADMIAAGTAGDSHVKHMALRLKASPARARGNVVPGTRGDR